MRKCRELCVEIEVVQQGSEDGGTRTIFFGLLGSRFLRLSVDETGTAENRKTNKKESSPEGEKKYKLSRPSCSETKGDSRIGIKYTGFGGGGEGGRIARCGLGEEEEEEAEERGQAAEMRGKEAGEQRPRGK